MIASVKTGQAFSVSIEQVAPVRPETNAARQEETGVPE